MGDGLFERAQRVTPGGVHSPVRAFRSVGGSPVFFARGNGAHIIGVDGKKYIDFCLSFGPLILGHADPDVARVVRDAVGDGWSFGACEPYSLALAEWITSRLPWVERIRFVSSGTEAVMSALRVARAATGRNKILKFEGCYHGHTDAMLVQAGSGLADGHAAASSAGVTTGTFEDTLVVPLDDERALDRVFETSGKDLAAVILELLPANYGLLPQRVEWIRGIADRCKRAGALVIADEVISGFRVGRGGMSERLGLEPDLVTYGKVVGGGFPVAGYAGRAKFMELVAPIGPVYQAGTLSANPVGMRAGLASLEKMDRLDGWRVLNARTEAFAKSLAADLARAKAPIDVVHDASMFWLRLHADQPVRRVADIPAGQGDWYRRFFHAALDRGVYLPPAAFEVNFLSMAHDEAILAEAREILVAAAVQAAAVGTPGSRS